MPNIVVLEESQSHSLGDLDIALPYRACLHDKWGTSNFGSVANAHGCFDGFHPHTKLILCIFNPLIQAPPPDSQSPGELKSPQMMPPDTALCDTHTSSRTIPPKTWEPPHTLALP